MRHSKVAFGAALLGLGAVTWGSSAKAQQAPEPQTTYYQYQSLPSGPQLAPELGVEGDYFKKGIPAPNRALELKIGSGYTQGIGMILPGTGMPSIAGPGIGVNADLDYRSTPHTSVGVAGQYQEFQNGRQNSAARGLAGTLGVTYHASPMLRGDPWARLGVGYRMLWSVDPVAGGPTTLIHGFDLAALDLGYDIRLSQGVAIAPMIGADVNLFLWEAASGTNTALSSAQVAMFVFGGLQGRFDAGGTTKSLPVVAKR